MRRALFQTNVFLPQTHHCCCVCLWKSIFISCDSAEHLERGSKWRKDRGRPQQREGQLNGRWREPEKRQWPEMPAKFQNFQADGDKEPEVPFPRCSFTDVRWCTDARRMCRVTRKSFHNAHIDLFICFCRCTSCCLSVPRCSKKVFVSSEIEQTLLLH